MACFKRSLLGKLVPHHQRVHWLRKLQQPHLQHIMMLMLAKNAIK